jgi:hypothetical protein
VERAGDSVDGSKKDDDEELLLAGCLGLRDLCIALLGEGVYSCGVSLETTSLVGTLPFDGGAEERGIS